MISKISKGKGFRGLLMYVAGKQDAELIGGNVSSNPQDAAREMGALRQFSACKTPVWHCSLSLSPQDRNLSSAEFAELAEKFLRKMGIENNQYTVYRHRDKEHAHIHIIVNRIGLDARHGTWNSWQDITRAREAKLQLEAEFGLQQVVHNPKFACPEVGRGQLEEAKRKRVIPSKEYVARAIAEATQRGNVKDFITYLNNQGVQAVPNISQTTGRMNGFSFVFGRRHYRGSQLRCAWRELAPRLNYNAEKDNEFLYSLLPQEKRPTPTAEPKEPPRRQYCIYTAKEWELMGGTKNSDYRRAYRMISDGYSLKDVAQELQLQNPGLNSRQIEKILFSSGKFWIENNRQKLSWAYRPRRSVRFSSDPTIMLIEVLALLISAAIKAGFRGIEEHRTRKQIDGISRELEDMAHYAEERVQKKREQAYRHEERAGREREERENPILSHAREISAEMSR